MQTCIQRKAESAASTSSCTTAINSRAASCPQPQLRTAGARHRQLVQYRCHAAAAAQPGLLYDFHDKLIPYQQAWDWQKARVTELCSAATADRRDTVFLLQHPPVYTLGAGSSECHVKFDLDQPPHPLYRTERGGEVTYHGPGQLVMYPILDLNRHTQDLHWYLRGLEEVIIRALADTSGLQGQRIEGLTGVWVDDHKLAAIGVRARKWVTYHGLALNVSTALQPFKLITPCGIADRPVGSVKTALEQTTGHQEAVHTAAAAAAAGGVGQAASNGSSSSSSRGSSASLGSSISGDESGAASEAEFQQQQQQQEHLFAVSADPLIVEYRYALLEALEDVFGLQLQPASQQQMQELLAKVCVVD